MRPILVTAYVGPDLDGVGGAMAYGEFLKKTDKDVVIGFIGELHDEAKYVLDRFNIAYPKKLENADDFDEVVLVDASDLNGLEGKIAPEKVIEVIDHRKVHEGDKFPNAKVQVELVGAAATLIAEKFIQSGAMISKESAILVYGAILSNTFNFKGSVTTDRDIEAGAWLNKIAQLPDDFWRDLFIAKSDLSGEKLVERIEGDFASFVLGGKRVGIAQIEIIGAKKLVEERGEEIIIELGKIKKEMNLDFIFQNTIELDGVKNFFIAQDIATQKLLEKILNIKFDGIIAERENSIMRKQIVPLLKEELESREYVILKIKQILEANKDKRVVVVGTTCTGKSTLRKEIEGAHDMDEILFPQLTAEESGYVRQKPWTPEIGETMVRFAKEKIKVEPGKPVFATIVLDSDLVVYLHINDELLRERTGLRGVDFENAKNMQTQIEQKIEESKIPVIRISVG